jgi:hypothetical protein
VARASAILAGAAALLGCVGRIGDRPEGATEAVPEQGALGSAPLRRLTGREHATSIRDLLGVDVSDVIASFPDDGTVDGFDNNAMVQTVTPQHARRWQEAAETAAQRLLADPARRDALVGCEPDGETREACLRSMIERFGRLAFRRTLLADEIEALEAVADAAQGDPDPYASVAMVVRAVLQAPQFVFRIERGAPVPGRSDVLRLTGPELATRLSFALWATTPSPALLDAAEAGALDDLEGLAAHARALAQDDRARDAARTFAAQWLRLGAMGEIELEAELFPAFGPDLRQAAVTEDALLADDFLRGDASLLGLYDAPYGYADAALAALYGVPAPASGSHEQLTVSERGGLFGTAGFAMLTSHPQNTSVVLRGKYVREVALCDPPPPPPADVSTVPLEPGVSALDASLAHAGDPACSGCHLRLDPIGLGLERFDAVGRLRWAYADGTPVASDGFVEGIEPGAFQGAVELARLVADSDMAARCVVEHYLRFALGKSLESAEQRTVTEVAARFAEVGHRFEELVVAISITDAFRYRPAAAP